MILCFLSGAAATARADESPAELEFFEKQVRPLLIKHCFNCHSAETNSRGGLRVDDRQGLLVGGNRGPAILPGKPEGSLLMEAVSHSKQGLKMPPDNRLADEEIDVLRLWIASGAVWTKTEIPDWLGQPNADYDRLRKDHWSWQPLVDSAVPEVTDQTWPLDDLDRFVLAKLEANQLAQVAPADRVTLIRRVTYDLTGLPPTPIEVSEFLSDVSPHAFAKVVDRLLNSAAFGERWGRHWLDVARYGESTGSSRNLPMPHAWRYRDYVIDSFNQDKPYDVFLREQIAGDLLPANSPRRKSEQLTATGFLAIGVKDVNQRFKVRFLMDNVDEQIDTVSRAVLGLTVSCARCHDHKFDPIPTTDYYALAGIFRSSDLCAGLRNQMGGGGLDYYHPDFLIEIGLESALPTYEQIVQLRQSVTELRNRFQKLKDAPEGAEAAADGRPKRDVAKQELDDAQTRLDALTDPSRGTVAYGVRDAKLIADTEVRIRGEAEQLGPTISRGFLGILDYPGRPQVNPRQSGRLELAEWLSSRQNPLTSRVIVNRIWKHLFGEGIVTTVDNFGMTGDRPSHRELLDHLALRVIRNGWSLKKTIRSIVLSRTYQLSAETTETQLTLDPENRLLWRHRPRRLDAEEIRDAMLAVSGRLNPSRPDQSLASGLRVIEIRNDGPEANRILEQAQQSVYRSVYLPLMRGITPVSLEVFDFGDQGMVTGRRDRTTVAPQALYLLNDPFVDQQSRAVAENLLSRTELDDVDRVSRAYRMMVARSPTASELDRALQFLAQYELAQRESLASVPGSTSADSGQTAAPPTGNAGEASPKSEGAGDGSPRPPGSSGSVPQKLPQARQEAWAAFCQALFGSVEFRFIK